VPESGARHSGQQGRKQIIYKKKKVKATIKSLYSDVGRELKPWYKVKILGKPRQKEIEVLGTWKRRGGCGEELKVDGLERDDVAGK